MVCAKETFGSPSLLVHGERSFSERSLRGVEGDGGTRDHVVKVASRPRHAGHDGLMAEDFGFAHIGGIVRSLRRTGLIVESLPLAVMLLCSATEVREATDPDVAKAKILLQRLQVGWS